MPAPSLVLCADIRHTLGASEYAYLSFLAIASRARRRLGMFGAVVVLLPRSLGGLRMDLLVTRDSLEAYGRGAGLTLLLDSDAGAAGHSCDHSNNDIRVTDKVRTHSSLLLPISPPQYNMTSRPPLDTFLDGVWSYIDAAAIARGRRTGSLRVSLSLVQASMGPLAHAASLLHTEALDIVRALAIAAPPQSLRLHPAHSPSSATPPSSCAYVFLGLFLGTGLIDLSTARPRVATAARTQAFRLLAAEVVQLARSAGLGCATVNSVFISAESEQRARTLFAEYYGETFQVQFVEKKSFSGPLTQWQEFGRGSDAALTTELQDNLQQRWAAYAAPLLISQSGSYWSDWLVAKRSAEGRSSAILANPESRRGTEKTHACEPLASRSRTSRDDRQRPWPCADCIFFRGHCTHENHTWIEPMYNEVGLCATRWQAGVLYGRPNGAGVQKIAVVGC